MNKIKSRKLYKKLPNGITYGYVYPGHLGRIQLYIGDWSLSILPERPYWSWWKRGYDGYYYTFGLGRIAEIMWINEPMMDSKEED